MAIVQISKIQVKTGNIADLPQLSPGEIGYATDSKQLFIGNDPNVVGPIPDNTEILTSASGSSLAVPGANTQVLFNDGGSLGAATGLTYNKADDVVGITGDLIPAANATSSLGNSTNQWKDMWVSGNTIYMQNTPITMGANSNLQVNGSNVLTVSPSGQMSATTISADSITSNLLTVNQDVAVGGNLTINGNITANGNIQIISGNSAQFFGNVITGANALYAGIPVGYAIVQQTVLQLSTNYNGYTQLNAQNINTGSQSSFDFVATADNGNETSRYITMGVASSTWDGTAPESLSNAVSPNDGYLYVDSGNLVLGTNTSGKVLKINVGAPDNTGAVAQFNLPNTLSTSATTGALTVVGGIGATGNITTSGNISASRLTGTGLTVSGVSNLNAVGNVIITGGTNGQVLTTNGSGVLSWSPVTMTPGGSNTQIQFNDAGVLAGNTNFTFNKATSTFTVTGTSVATTFSGNGSSLTALNGSNISFGIIAQARLANSTMTVNGSTLTLGATSTITAAAGTLTGSTLNSTVTGSSLTSVGTLGSLAVSGVSNLNAVGNVIITGGTNGQVLTTNGSGNLSWSTVSVGGNTPGGSNTQIQFNDNGTFGGSANITFNKTTDTFTVTGTSAATTFSGSGSSLTTLNASNISSGTLAQARLANTAVILGSTTLTLGGTTTTVAGLTSVTSTTFVGSLTGAATSATTAGTVTTAAQSNITSVGTLTSLAVTGNITSGNISGTTGAFTNVSGNGSSLSSLTGANVIGAVPFASTSNAVAGGNVSGQVANALVAGTVYTAAQSNITSVGTLTGLTVSGVSNLNAVGNVIITGGTTGQVLSTNGSGNLSWVTVGGAGASSNIANGTSNVNIATSGGNVTVTTAGNTTLTVTGTGANISGTANISGNANVGNLETSGRIVSSISTGTAPFVVTSTTQVANLNVATSGLATFATTANSVAGANVTGEVGFAATANAVAGANISGTVASATTAGTVTTASQGNITSVGTLTSLSVSGSLTNRQITTGAAATTGNITGTWTLTAGSSLEATYADMAERYTSDDQYPPGTVLMIGGTEETTIATESGATRIAGVVSSEPAYVLNSTLKDSVVIALIGRVPCKVVGTIVKGDLLTVSIIPGVATATVTPQCGTILGRALESYDSTEVGVIEIKVDRG